MTNLSRLGFVLSLLVVLALGGLLIGSHPQQSTALEPAGTTEEPVSPATALLLRHEIPDGSWVVLSSSNGRGSSGEKTQPPGKARKTTTTVAAVITTSTTATTVPTTTTNPPPSTTS